MSRRLLISSTAARSLDMKRTLTDDSAGESSSRPKRPVKESWDSRLKDRFGLQWCHGGPFVKPGLPSLYILHAPMGNGEIKMAMFDMDWTLIKPKSGGKWPKGPSDWCWLYPQIPGKLKQLVEEKFHLMIISNQRGIEKNNTKLEDIKQKIAEIILKLEVPCEAMFGTGESHFLKPATGGWDYYVKTFLGDGKLDMSASFYVGDAAGRPKDYRPGRKKDFSCSDRMFAANIGVAFHTPEEFFLKEKVATFSWCSASPTDIIKEGTATKLEEKYHADSVEIVVMVGPPASGKSSFATKHLVPHGYLRVNRDELKTQSACIQAAKTALNEKKSVVIDNTNPSVADRKQYLDLAKAKGVPCRCFIMNTPLPWASHLNYYRQALTQSKVRRIPKVAYNVYKSRYEAPKDSEKFNEIKTIPFVPNFVSDKQRQLFLKWTSEV